MVLDPNSLALTALQEKPLLEYLIGVKDSPFPIDTMVTELLIRGQDIP